MFNAHKLKIGETNTHLIKAAKATRTRRSYSIGLDGRMADAKVTAGNDRKMGNMKR